MAVESNGGLYRVDKPFKLAAGEARKVNLAITQDAPPAGGKSTPASGKKSGGGVWSSPALASVIVVGSAIIVGLVIDNATSSPAEQPGVSPF
jgi:hypothetical protein